jgi:two-component system, OmpR family, sensor histidine kinase KdpD
MNQRARRAGRLMISLGLVGLVTAAYSLAVQVNPTTIALTYVVVILLLATGWGIAESTTASLAAMLCFNFFFLPPVGALTIADPQNWVALVAFLLTAIITSQLSGRARRRHMDALTRQRDLERLYVLSRALLLSERGLSVPGQIARHIADAFELQTVGVYDQRTDAVAWAGARDWAEIDGQLREVARHGGSLRDPAGFIILAIQLGAAPIGSIAVADEGLSNTVLHSITNLAAIGLERARANEATARADAARESSELRATVLDALAHDFKTPLTSMKAASSNLLVNETHNSVNHRELVAIIDEDIDRLSALVTDAVQMLRIDAGDFAVHLERLDLAAVVAGTVQRFKRQLDGHDLVTSVPDGLTVDADRDLLALALRQLLDNALKYSPSTSTIEIQAQTNGSVDLTVRNSGSTIPHGEQARVLERFYRGAQARKIPGTGMGLAIVRQIAGAHQGTLAVASSPETGTSFTLSLPREGRTS